MKVSINNIGGGCLPSLFERELERILENVADTRTKANAIRKIKIEIKFMPSDDRDLSAVQVNASSALAPARPQQSFIYHSLTDDGLAAETTDPRQQQLFGLEPAMQKKAKENVK